MNTIVFRNLTTRKMTLPLAYDRSKRYRDIPRGYALNFGGRNK